MSDGKIDIRPADLEIVQKILRDHLPKDAKVWVFGSRATWTTKDSSDLDLAIDAGRALTLEEMGSLSEAFEESDLPYKVDVVDMATVGEKFRGIIENNRLVVLENCAGAWINTTIGAQATLQRGVDITKAEQRSGLIPVISSGGVSSFHDTPAAKGPGVVLGRKGVVGSVYYIASDYWPHDTTLWVKDFHENDPRFVYYFFRWMAKRIATMDVGSANPTLNRNHVHPIEIMWPSRVAEQKSIAHILGTLDDKIELNRRMNETLEAMARALFKSWFVDFEPVRAKSEGRDTGLPPDIAALFPDSFEDSELGEIPRGWTVGKLGDVLIQRIERCVASDETASRPYVPIDCISPKSLFLTESKPGHEAQSSLTKFYKHDILFGAMRPYFHKVCIAPFDGTTRTTAFVLYPRQKADYSFATLQMHQTDTIDFATRHSTGSTIPYAVWAGSLEEMPVVLPSADIRKVFNRSVLPILTRIPEPYFEIKTLETIRDSLLPKLISGEIRASRLEESERAAS